MTSHAGADPLIHSEGAPFSLHSKKGGYNPGMTAAGMYPKSECPPHSKHNKPGSNPSSSTLRSFSQESLSRVSLKSLSQEFLSGVSPRRGWCKWRPSCPRCSESDVPSRLLCESCKEVVQGAPFVCNMAEACPLFSPFSLILWDISHYLLG